MKKCVDDVIADDDHDDCEIGDDHGDMPSISELTKSPGDHVWFSSAKQSFTARNPHDKSKYGHCRVRSATRHSPDILAAELSHQRDRAMHFASTGVLLPAKPLPRQSRKRKAKASSVSS